MSHNKIVRQRTTWGRKAAEAPADPGRELETKVWPGAEGDHDESLYETGSFEQWAELPVPGPYPKGEPPADPGTEEEGMHPAARRAAARGEGRRAAEKEAQSIKRRSARCVAAAEKWLGRRASEAEVERLAERLMDNPQRLAELEGLVGGPTACPDADMDMDMDMDMEGPVPHIDIPVEDEFVDMPDGAYDDLEMVAMRDKMASLEKTLTGVGEKLASLMTSMKGDKAKTAADKGRALVASQFEALIRSYGGKDGKIRLAEWKGPRGVFALLDRNDDGVITTTDLLAAWGYKRKAEDEDEDDKSEDESGDKGKEAGKKAEMPPEFLEQQKKMKEKSEDKDDGKDDGKDDDGKKASAKAAKKAPVATKKKAEGEEAIVPEDDEEADAKKASAKAPAKAPVKASKPKGATQLRTAEEDDGDGDEGGEDESGEDDGKEASKKAAADKKARLEAARRAHARAAELLRLAEEESEEAKMDESEDDMDKSAADDDSEVVEDTGDEDDMDKSATIDHDPMGMAGAGDLDITAAEAEALAQLYGPGEAGAGVPRQAGEMNLRPQPKKPSSGVKTARVASGQQQRRAGAAGVPNDLSGIWGAPPDVAGHFRTGT